MIFFKTRQGNRVSYSSYSELDEAYEPAKIKYNPSMNWATFEKDDEIFLTGLTYDNRVIFSYIKKENYKTELDFFDVEMCPNTVLYNFKHILFVLFEMISDDTEIIRFENNRFYTFFNNMFKKENVLNLFRDKGFVNFEKRGHEFIFSKGD